MNIKHLLGRTFSYGRNGCWWLEREKGVLSVFAVNALAGGEEVKMRFSVDQEECWYAPSPEDEYERLDGQISPEVHEKLLRFRNVAEKILRQFGG